MAGTLDKALSFRTENTEMSPTDLDTGNGDQKEAVYPIEDLELLASGAK